MTIDIEVALQNDVDATFVTDKSILIDLIPESFEAQVT